MKFVQVVITEQTFENKYTLDVAEITELVRTKYALPKSVELKLSVLIDDHEYQEVDKVSLTQIIRMEPTRSIVELPPSKKTRFLYETVSIDRIKIPTERFKVPHVYMGLLESIKKEGLRQPIVVKYRDADETYNLLLLDGFHRLEAMKELGHTEIKVAIAINGV
jgi:uncharacterized ParB-like nuclease family protein